MTQTPPDAPQHAAINVDLPLIPIMQQWHVTEGQVQPPGEAPRKVVWLTIVQPMGSFIVMLDQENWQNLRGSIDPRFSGIEVARDLPRSNGRGDVPPGFRP